MTATTTQGAIAQMRRLISLAAVLALAACGGGGGGSAPVTTPINNPTVAPSSDYVTPQFVLTIPARGPHSGKARNPQFISSSTASVKILLTADSVGITPGSITGNPAITNIAANSCNSGCTVSGPPSPPGTDSYLVVTYDANNATGNALNAGVLTGVTVTAGQANTQSLTLGGIPASLTINSVPSTTWNAGTQSQKVDVTVTAADADGNTIASGSTPYIDATGAAVHVTLTDPDTNLHGTCLVASGNSSTCTTGALTTATFNTPNDKASFAYDGLAENPLTLTASAPGATNGTASFRPNLNAPAFNSSQATPSGVALTSSPEIDLFATSGTGSTGSESFTESGWTNSPYNHALTHAETGACTTGAGITATSMADIATIATGANSTTNGTPFTATVVGSPKTGSCPSTISDGLSLNPTEGSATLTVTYTTFSVNGSSKHRHQ